MSADATTAGCRAAARSHSRRGLGPLLGLILALTLSVCGPLVPRDGSRTTAAPYSPPGVGLPLGSDGLGRDVLARLLNGGAGLVLIALGATAVAVLLGLVLGVLLTAHSRVARVGARVLDIVLVIPPILTMLVLIFGLGGGVATMFLITAAVTTPFVARYVRSLVVPMLTGDVVVAARLAADGWLRIAAGEILPRLVAPLLTDAGTRFVGALYLVASAGFLGFNPLGGDGDWATMIQANMDGMAQNPWASLAPAISVILLTVSANLLSDHWLGGRNR